MSALWAALPAAGSGSRLGSDAPKQFLKLRDRSVLEWSVDVLRRAVPLEGIVIAVPAEALGSAEAKGVLADEHVHFCAGGASRAESVIAALQTLPAAPEDWVLVHDAARPCVPLADVRTLVEEVTRTGIGGILAAPMTDTLKRAGEAGRVDTTVERAGLWRAMTPQMFRVGELLAALHDAKVANAPVTDEASAMELAGHPVCLVPGSAANIKITFAEDLPLAEFQLRQQGEIA